MADDPDLAADAALLALDALDDVERARLLRRVARSSPAERRAFEGEVAAARETMAELSRSTASAPPEELRRRLLDRIADEPHGAAAPGGEPAPGQRRWRVAAVAAAAAIVLGAGGAVLGYSIADRAETESTTVDEIFAAPDVRTVSGDLAGGRATITYAPSTGEGVLVMNQVPRPAPGTIYQMWLDGPDGPRLAGTMSESDVAPSTTAVIRDMGGATAVSFTVGDASEPEKRVGDAVATFPLS